MRYSAWLFLCALAFGCQSQSVSHPEGNNFVLADDHVPVEVSLLLEQHELEKAVEKLGELISQNPSDAALHSVRATVQHRLGLNQQAITDLNRAIELNPKEARFFNNRGFIFLGLQRFEEAEHDLDRAKELAPGYPNGFNNRGLLHLSQGRYVDAISEFDRALRIDPQYVDAYNNRGFAEMQLQHVESALADFNTTLAMSPRYVNAFNNRGLLRARVGDLENAVIDFTEAMMLDPLNPKYYQLRREVYLRQQAYDKAEEDQNKYVWLEQLNTWNVHVANNPDDSVGLIRRARHHLQARDDVSAALDVERALKINARSADALILRAEIEVGKKEFQRALADAETALSIDPTREAFSVLGDACLGLDNYDRAISSFNEAHRIDSAVAEAYFRKSQILQISGNTAEATSTLQQAVFLDQEIEARLR